MPCVLPGRPEEEFSPAHPQKCIGRQCTPARSIHVVENGNSFQYWVVGFGYPECECGKEGWCEAPDHRESLENFLQTVFVTPGQDFCLLDAAFNDGSTDFPVDGFSWFLGLPPSIDQ